jgi:lipoic acid synthetase
MSVGRKVLRVPEYIRNRPRNQEAVRGMKVLLRGAGLRTVCEEARCPNQAECFSNSTATFMILGRVCTRRCLFCAVKKGEPEGPDPEEAGRVAKAAAGLGLKYVVVTSVTRDDLDDGGAGFFAETICALRGEIPGVEVEVLTPDFKGSEDAIRVVVEAGPDVYNHNLETVPRLYSLVRPIADYERSLELLRKVKMVSPGGLTKSGLMLGLGERLDEVVDVMHDLREVDCEVLTIGQYLCPSLAHHPVARYYDPEEFEELSQTGLGLGFKEVYSGPLVRSSFHARELKARTAGSPKDPFSVAVGLLLRRMNLEDMR